MARAAARRYGSTTWSSSTTRNAEGTGGLAGERITTSGPVGILGGTFDPVHNGHLAAARQLLTAADLGEVWLVPNAHPPHRAEPTDASPEDRMRMVELAVDAQPRLRALRIELERGGRSYTIDTIRSLRDGFPGVVFRLLIGYDAALHIREWHKAEELLAQASFVVFNRPSATVAPQTIHELGFPPERTRIVHIETPPISAHQVRDRLARRASIDDLVADSVATYIREHSLYRPLSQLG